MQSKSAPAVLFGEIGQKAAVDCFVLLRPAGFKPELLQKRHGGLVFPGVQPLLQSGMLRGAVAGPVLAHEAHGQVFPEPAAKAAQQGAPEGGEEQR